MKLSPTERGAIRVMRGALDEYERTGRVELTDMMEREAKKLADVAHKTHAERVAETNRKSAAALAEFVNTFGKGQQ